jgi:hypothetical protein
MVLTPLDGSPAELMLVAILMPALFRNGLTWAFCIPNNDPHFIIGGTVRKATA